MTSTRSVSLSSLSSPLEDFARPLTPSPWQTNVPNIRLEYRNSTLIEELFVSSLSSFVRCVAFANMLSVATLLSSLINRHRPIPSSNTAAPTAGAGVSFAASSEGQKVVGRRPSVANGIGGRPVMTTKDSDLVSISSPSSSLPFHADPLISSLLALSGRRRHGLLRRPPSPLPQQPRRLPLRSPPYPFPYRLRSSDTPAAHEDTQRSELDDVPQDPGRGDEPCDDGRRVDAG